MVKFSTVCLCYSVLVAFLVVANAPPPISPASLLIATVIDVTSDEIVRDAINF